MLPYNTDQKPLILPEYGRHIQQMVDHCLSIEDRSERTRCAVRIASIMANLFPELKGENGDNHKIWDHINIMSRFQLDVDFPCEVISSENLNPAPKSIPYTQGFIRYRHYGKNIERMIDIVSDMEGGDEKDMLISMIAHHLKKLMMSHNKESLDDARILKDLNEYSGYRIELDPETYHLRDFRDPSQPQPQQGKKKRKK